MRPSAAAAQGSAGNAQSSQTTNSDEGAAQNGQDRKFAFVNASVDRRTVSPDRVTRLASPYVVQAGTIIPGALITGIRSDLPGQITAQVTESVFDSPTILEPNSRCTPKLHCSVYGEWIFGATIVWLRKPGLTPAGSTEVSARCTSPPNPLAGRQFVHMSPEIEFTVGEELETFVNRL